ncbi:ngd5/osm-6/ift52 [Holotrichia oblita]|uniref:Ngd5/osm-6/ift52 n=1 Tax=Holotrichia oblita TaxID=644536 RepID=A0ACB9TPK4_HOLOL|nr:ngd5/osm-6/ift52 [Holotrichia oblita]
MFRFSNKEEISSQILKTSNIIILPGSQNPFEESELNALKSFINEGGRVLVLLAESNQDDTSNINILLEEYGIIPNMDCLIRTHYYKYFHPKECYISDISINTSLNKDKASFNIVYPFGCTMNVNKPGVVAFTSGSTTFPVDRPLGALYYNQNTGMFNWGKQTCNLLVYTVFRKNVGKVNHSLCVSFFFLGGRLIAIGTGHMFADKYLDQEKNEPFREMVFEFLTTNDNIKVTPSDHDDMDVWDYHNVPDTAELSERPKLCLTDAISHTVSADYSKLFDHKMYSMNTSLVPEAIGLYEKLGVKHQPLKVIRPNFEAPLPPLQAAVSYNVLMFRVGIS